MQVLIVAATAFEVAPLAEKLKAAIVHGQISSVTYKNLQVDLLISGVGIAQTAFFMGKCISLKKYDLAINAGVCGAFERSLKTGEVINITKDCFADLGAEDDEKFLSLEELKLPGIYSISNENVFGFRLLENIRKVEGVTVNTSHGNEKNIASFLKRMPVAVESMEGAAFMMACENENIPYLQLRSVSNYVEKRDKGKWNMPLAISSLNEFLCRLMEEISSC